LISIFAKQTFIYYKPLYDWISYSI